MEAEKMVCIFCGGRAAVKEKDNQKVVICPKCKRKTDLDIYQEMFDRWMGDVRVDE